MNVLAIESSCDETAVAVYSDTSGLLAHNVYSQIELHRPYGGVVPELASRDHIKKALPLLQKTLTDAGITQQQLDGIAFTKGPGLIGALMVGASLATSIAYAWQLPVIGVHHLEAHLMAVMLEDKKPDFPFVALLVSGGHTQLMHVKAPGDYALLGESVDDAAGEAFDKVAKLLGLPYPGGPALAKLAESGNANAYQFPRPMTNRPGLDFSFSGLKTFAVNTFQQSDQSKQVRADIACAFEDAVVDTLLIKCKRAIEQTNAKTLVMVGGVSANKKLRARLADKFSQQGVSVFYPRHEFCTDNAAMVAYTGWMRLAAGQKDDYAIKALPRWPIVS